METAPEFDQESGPIAPVSRSCLRLGFHKRDEDRRAYPLTTLKHCLSMVAVLVNPGGSLGGCAGVPVGGPDPRVAVEGHADGTRPRACVRQPTGVIGVLRLISLWRGDVKYGAHCP